MRRAVFYCLLLFCTSFSAFTQKDCPQSLYQQAVLASSPLMPAISDNIEAFTSTILSIANQRNNTGQADIAEKQIVIPVVVHVLYHYDRENIAVAQVMSQLAVLNDDYSAANADRARLPLYFTPLLGSVNIRFELATTAPDGTSTTGITRRKIFPLNFTTDDRMKYTSTGGENAWDLHKYLNIWVCPLANGVLGYASLPGCESAIDGVVINTIAFGTIGTVAPFDRGRTATHEIGHWLNLRHLWGDAACGNDNVDDTPQQQGPNRGCPDGERKTCGNTTHGDMYMNFMDLTDDGCMYMFTAGQKARMRALFAPGGPRNALLSSDALRLSPVPSPTDAALEVGPAVYPVPATNQLTVRTGYHGAGMRMKIYNQVGVVVMVKQISDSEESVDISGLKPGNYYLRFEGSSAAALRFVKM